MAPNRYRTNNKGRKSDERRRKPRSAILSRCSCATSVDSMKKQYRKIKKGLRKSVPAAIVLYPFHKIGSRAGLTTRRIISFLRKNCGLSGSGKAVGSVLRGAVEFGLITKRGNKFFLAKKNK